jgi:hypothetical protein
VLLLFNAVRLFFRDWASISPAEEIRQHTEAILQAVQNPLATHTSSATPDELGRCGNWFPEVLKRNNNQYSIVITGIWGDGASPIPGGTGSITATVHVIFPDDTRIEMQYYAYTLDLCRLIHDGTEEF